MRPVSCCFGPSAFQREKLGPNRRALKSTGQEDKFNELEQIVVSKHKGDDGKTLGYEEGVRQSTKSRLR